MIQIGLTDYTPENKIIDIKDKSGVIKAMYAIGEKDMLKYTLMDEHCIEISFELNGIASFKRSDHITWDGDKYTLRSDFSPEQVNKRRYRYTLKFEAVEMFFQDIQYYYLNQDLKESEWRLTGNPEYFIKIAVDNINRYFGTPAKFTVGTIEPAEIKDIMFGTDTNTFDALTQIADEYGAEWYITGKTIHLLNKVSFGSEVDFETEVSVLSMKRDEGDGNTKYTRIMALGSDRNLPKDYREHSSGEAVDAVYPKRLRIPASKGDVIDVRPDMLPDEVVEGTVIFDEIYPKRIGTIEAVGTIEYTDTDQDTGEQTKWNAYKFKDSGIRFKEEYVLPGQELKLSFQSGDLNGRDFALFFHEKGFSDTDNSQCFEIVRTDEYGKELPNDTMKPKPGDKYVLYGFNIALVSDEYVPAAELELYDTAAEWLQKQLQDTGVYECASAIKYFTDNLMNLEIGQRVRLVHEQFDGGCRSSRIMGFEKKLNNKYDAVYTVGDNPTYSRFGEMEKDIKEMQYAGIVYENKGGGNVYVIKQFDNTRPTNFNVYSAAASDAKYLNKQTGGTVSGDVVFEKNMQVQGIAVSDVFQNSTFTAGQLGSGFQIKRDANGQSYMEIDNLLIRREAVFNRLTVAEIKSVGGTILLSLASMVVSKVEADTDAWKCCFDNDDATIPNDFAVGDQAICRKFTGKDIKYYWALVTAVGADYVELSKTDKDGSGSPDVDDEIVQLGNRTDVNRQSAIMLSAYGSDATSIKQYAGINSYDMTDKEATVISPKGNKFTGSFTVSTNGTTAPIYKDLGLFVNGRVYYLNDRVSHLGSYWVCIVNSTVQMPNETSTVWRKDTAGDADIDNAVGGLRQETTANLEVLSGQISSKVSQTDFNDLGKRVTTAETELKQTESSIVGIAERVTGTESNIGKLQLRADGFDVEITKTNTKIDQNGVQLMPHNWKTGSGSNEPYIMNGLASENHRVYGDNHLGQRVILWECRPSGDGQGDGGWNMWNIPLDKTKTYRYSVFVKKLKTTGSAYLGPRGGTVCSLNTITVPSNPYFWHGTLPAGVWCLIVGYVYPYGQTGLSVQGGRYNCETGQLLGPATESFNHADVTEGGQRAYLYYEQDSANRQWFWQPRVDLIDGNEPSIQELMGLAETPDSVSGKIKVEADKITLAVKNDLSGSGIDITAKKLTLYSGAGGGGAQGKIVIVGSNFSVDENGYLKAVNGEFSGKITAAAGKIGNWNIDSGGLYTNVAGTNGGSLRVEQSGTRFLRINDSASALMNVRANAGTGINIYTDSASGVGLQITAQAGSFAIRSHGSHYLIQRTGEAWTAPGILAAGSFHFDANVVTGVSFWAISNISVTVTKVSNNEVLITHNLGHTDYQHLVWREGGSAYQYLAKTANNFRIDGIQSGSGKVCFLIIGRNKNV